MSIGRAPGCRIIIEQSEVSRNHAQFLVSEEQLVIEDMQSTNGVYVNDERVKNRRVLVHGDRLLVGTEEMLVIESHEAPTRPMARPPAAGHRPEPSKTAPPERLVKKSPPPDILQPTEKADAIETLGRLADRMLSVGRIDAANKLMSQHLRNVLNAAEHNEQLTDQVVIAAANYALRLADAMNSGVWLSYVLDLFIALRKPLGTELAGKVSDLIIKGVQVDQRKMQKYKDQLRSASNGKSLMPDCGMPTVPPPPKK